VDTAVLWYLVYMQFMCIVSAHYDTYVCTFIKSMFTSTKLALSNLLLALKTKTTTTTTLYDLLYFKLIRMCG